MSGPVRGMLDLEALRREVGEGRIETIITASTICSSAGEP